MLGRIFPVNLSRNSLEFSFLFFILVPHTISLGRCDEISFSICWMTTIKDDALDRQNGNIWLNDTALKSIRSVGKVTSLTVYPAVENKLTLRYGGSVQAWTFTINPRSKFTKIRGRQKPLEHPTHATKGFLNLLGLAEVFACENGTLFFHQDENFFLAIGHTTRLPVKLESRSPSMLLVSWAGAGLATGGSCALTLYGAELDSYNMVGKDSTFRDHYRFTALDSCSPHVACVETAGTHTFTCLSAITDPDIPKDFEVTSWNSSSISLAWDCPENQKYSLFLLTVFYLNGTDHIKEEVPLWHREDSLAFSLFDLQPCTRVRFGLQTVCWAGAESRYSRMVLNDGNSVHSSIRALRQTSFGPDNYTLSWEVRNTSSISVFRVYHEGVLRGTTLDTSYTVGGLPSCRRYRAEVEALCGDGVLMSSKTVTAHTGPQGVSELRYRSNDSTALWAPGGGLRASEAFLYELSLENGTSLQSSRVTEAQLRLPGLEEGKTYVLDVWEECDGPWPSEHSRLCFEGANSSLGLLVRAAAPNLDLELQLDFSSLGLTMLVPWSLPEDLQDGAPEPRTAVEKIFKDKLQELLRDFDPPARVELVALEPAEEPDRTQAMFLSFDASQPDVDMPLPVEAQLDYIRSLDVANVTVADGVIRWDGEDLCASFKHTLCPRSSLCVNTLGSYTCVCQRGYYDVSGVVQPPEASRPVCNENGLFNQCLDKVVAGGLAKPYLTSHMGGGVDVRLNDGQCPVDESEMFYYFRTSRKSSDCGTVRKVNKTHIEFQNTLTVTLTEEQTISRRDLKVILKCVYARHYVRNAHVRMDIEWLSSLSLVELNSSLPLALSMSLYLDGSFTDRYRDAVALGPEDMLFLRVDLQTNHSFALDVLLRVESCWATESTDPQDAVRGVLLQDGCPVDNTFHWLSINGRAQSSRFSIQMFTMPRGLPLYIHCLANICGPDEDCTKSCGSRRHARRSASPKDRKGKRATLVSAGPLLIDNRVTSHWPEHPPVIFIVAGSIGFLGITVLSVSATKAIMTYYERLRLQ